MTEYDFWRAIGSAFWVFMSGVIVATAIWLVRRFCPPAAQWWLLTPLGVIIRRLVGRAFPRFRAEPRHAQEDPARLAQHQ